MEKSVTRQFVILSLHPEKGRVMIPSTHFRYALTGSVLMDFLLRGEISLEDKRLKTSFRRNGDKIHDLFAEKMEKQKRPRKISFWIRRFSFKNNLIFKETVNSLVSNGILMCETHYFLNLIPYRRYHITDKRIRTDIINELRDVLLKGTGPTGFQSMLIGLLKASGASHLLAKERSEKKILRKKCRDFKTDDEMSSEIDRAIREVQAAIVTSVITASAASSGHH